MNMLFNILLLIPVMFATVVETPLWEKLERLTWKNRVVLVYTPVDGSKEVHQQIQLLSNHTEGFKERDIVVIECVGPALSSEDKNLINRRFNHNLSAFGVWLIGKDGAIKLSSTQPLTTEKLFGLIDTMPMRRSEMKPKN